VLATHVDSVPGAPGAADAGVGLAVILETVRALGPEAGRNDLVVLIVDGEEDGLLGSQAFLADVGGELREPVVVLNHEARGTSGQPIVSRWSGPMHEVMGAVPSPEAESFTDAVFAFIPNDTDFTEYRAAGWWGMDMAVIGGSWAYHSPQDDAEHLDPATLQRFGDMTLAMTTDLLERDLQALDDDAPSPVVTTGPGGLLSLPAWGVLIAAGLGILAALGSVALAARRGRATWRGTVMGALGGLSALVLAVVAAVGAWWACSRIAPGMLSAAVGEPVIAWPFLLGEALLVVTALSAVFAVLRRWLGVPALTLGAGLLAVVLLASLSAFSPALGGWLQLPATVAAAGAFAADAVRGGSERDRGVGGSRRVTALVLALLGALPMAWVLGAQGSALVEFGIASSNGLLAGVLGLGALVAFSPVARALARPASTADAPSGRPHRPGRGLVPAVPVAALVLTLMVDASGLVATTHSGEPEQERVTAQIDATTGEGTWTSTGATAWGQALDGTAVTGAELDGPLCEVISVEPTSVGTTWVRLRASSPRHATRLTLDLAEGRMTGLAIDGSAIPAPAVAGSAGGFATGGHDAEDAEGSTSWRIVGLREDDQLQLTFRWEDAPGTDTVALAAALSCTDETFEVTEVPGYVAPVGGVSLFQPAVRVTAPATTP
jgi:hypothetical protein